MRNLSILYGIVLESLLSDRTEKYNDGICGEINFLADRGYNVTTNELNKLRLHFDKQNPKFNKKNAKWVKHPLYIGSSYWFVQMKPFGLINQKAVDVRVEFIKHIMKSLK